MSEHNSYVITGCMCEGLETHQIHWHRNWSWWFRLFYRLWHTEGFEGLKPWGIYKKHTKGINHIDAQWLITSCFVLSAATPSGWIVCFNGSHVLSSQPALFLLLLSLHCVLFLFIFIPLNWFYCFWNNVWNCSVQTHQASSRWVWWQAPSCPGLWFLVYGLWWAWLVWVSQ